MFWSSEVNLVGVGHISSLLGVSRAAVRKLVAKGKLPKPTVVLPGLRDARWKTCDIQHHLQALVAKRASRLDGRRHPRLVNEQGVSALLGVSVGQVRRLSKQHLLPTPLKIDKTELWVVHEIERFIKIAMKDFRHVPKGSFSKLPSTVESPPTPEVLLPLAAYLKYRYHRPGIYFLMLAGKIVYIGSAICPPKRIDQHRLGTYKTPAKEFDDYFVYPCPVQELIEKERIFIVQFNPPLNIAMKRPDLTPTANGGATIQVSLNGG